MPSSIPILPSLRYDLLLHSTLHFSVFPSVFLQPLFSLPYCLHSLQPICLIPFYHVSSRTLPTAPFPISLYPSPQLVLHLPLTRLSFVFSLPTLFVPFTSELLSSKASTSRLPLLSFCTSLEVSLRSSVFFYPSKFTNKGGDGRRWKVCREEERL
uniref:Uncharacterized protein n=1 Tax=Cacopsylla melanoneura TaxID=428564 RepID=A0A8D8ZB18_9HEMI